MGVGQGVVTRQNQDGLAPERLRAVADEGLSLARAAALGAPTPPAKPEFDPLTVARLGRPPLIIPR